MLPLLHQPWENTGGSIRFIVNAFVQSEVVRPRLVAEIIPTRLTDTEKEPDAQPTKKEAP